MFTLGLARSTCISEFTGSPCLICLTWFTVDWVGRSVGRSMEFIPMYMYGFIYVSVCICVIVSFLTHSCLYILT